MNQEQTNVYILSQIASMYAEMYGMLAANEERARRGLAEAYPGDEFFGLPGKYQLTHNQIMSLFQGGH